MNEASGFQAAGTTTAATGQSRTIWVSQAEWQGRLITVQTEGEQPCAVHQLEALQNADGGTLLWCPVCGGTADESDPGEWLTHRACPH